MARKSRTIPAEVTPEPVEETIEEEIIPEEESQQAPTIADRFVAINNLIVDQRKTTRLSEATLIKSMEIALQYHAWDYQRALQEAQQRNPFGNFPQSGGDVVDEDGLIGPEPHEFLDTIEDEPDNIVPVDFTPAEETE